MVRDVDFAGLFRTPYITLQSAYFKRILPQINFMIAGPTSVDMYVCMYAARGWGYFGTAAVLVAESCGEQYLIGQHDVCMYVRPIRDAGIRGTR